MGLDHMGKSISAKIPVHIAPASKGNAQKQHDITAISLIGRGSLSSIAEFCYQFSACQHQRRMRHSAWWASHITTATLTILSAFQRELCIVVAASRFNKTFPTPVILLTSSRVYGVRLPAQVRAEEKQARRQMTETDYEPLMPGLLPPRDK